MEALRDGRDDDLIGLEESRWFDAKGEAYAFSSDRGKWELAKDASAMANADGGLLLVGARTTKEEAWLEERVTSIVPVPARLLDVQQHLDAINARTFPPMAHRVRAQLFRRGSDKGLLAVEIERAPDDEQPILVRTLADGGKNINAFAIARRYGTGTEWMSDAQIWADIRDGRLARQNLHLVAPPEPDASASEHLQDRVTTIETLIDSAQHMTLSYSVRPPAHADRLPTFFSDDGMLGALRRLPDRAIRRSGFGLGYGLEVDTIDGALAVIEPRTRGLLVERTGLVLATAAGTDEFLGWATRGRFAPASLADGPSIALNHIVLAEYTLEFARFVRDEIIADRDAAGWRYTVVGRRLRSGTPRVFFPTNMHWMSSAARTPLIDDATENIEATGDPEIDAFRLLAEFLQWFGLEDDSVPYSSNGRISAEAIKSAAPS